MKTLRVLWEGEKIQMAYLEKFVLWVVAFILGASAGALQVFIFVHQLQPTGLGLALVVCNGVLLGVGFLVYASRVIKKAYETRSTV